MSSCNSGLATKALQPKLRARVHVGRSHVLSSPSTFKEVRSSVYDEPTELTGMHPQAFSTSRCFSPPSTLSDLFHSDNVLGVLPFKGFPSPSAEHLSVSRYPHDLISEEIAFRAFSSQRIRAHPNRQLRHVKRPILSWAFSSPGFPSTCDRHRFTRGVPSCAFSNACPKTFISRHFRV